MINWGTFMMEVSKTPSVLIGLVFTAITICLTIFNLWWSMRNRVEAEWTVSVTSNWTICCRPMTIHRMLALMKAQTTQLIAQTQMIEFASITPRPFR